MKIDRNDEFGIRPFIYLWHLKLIKLEVVQKVECVLIWKYCSRVEVSTFSSVASFTLNSSSSQEESYRKKRKVWEKFDSTVFWMARDPSWVHRVSTHASLLWHSVLSSPKSSTHLQGFYFPTLVSKSFENRLVNKLRLLHFIDYWFNFVLWLI